MVPARITDTKKWWTENVQTFCIGCFAVPVFSNAWRSVLAVLHALPGNSLHQEQQNVLSPRDGNIWKSTHHYETYSKLMSALNPDIAITNSQRLSLEPISSFSMDQRVHT